jgi:hypothetical protein
LRDDSLVQVMIDLHRAADRIAALATSATYAVNVRGAARAEGFVSVKRLLEVRAGKSSGNAASTLAVATALRTDFRDTGAAWLAGQISADAASAVARGVDTALRGVPAATVVDERSRFEAAGLHAARTGTVTDVRRAIAAMRIVIDPDAVDAAAVTARESQFLRFTPVSDGVDVTGFLTTETAAAVLTALDQRVNHYHRSGQLTDIEQHTLDSSTPAARRGLRERLNVDALTDVVRHQLDGGLLGTKHEQRPHVTVTVHADEHADGRGGTILLPGFGTVPVGSATVSRILCDADVTPVATSRQPVEVGYPGDEVLRFDPSDPRSFAPWLPSARALTLVETIPAPDPPGSVGHAVTAPPANESPGTAPPATDCAEDRARADREWVASIIAANGRRVIDVGRSSRTAPPRLRKALEIRDRTCRFPGCNVDASRTEAHHVIHWEHGGLTDLDNMLLLCSRHHHLVHEGRWTISARYGLHPGDPEYFVFVAPTRRPRY